MHLLALGIGLRRPGALEGFLREVALHRHVVLARLAQVAPRRVHARPRRGFPVEGDGDVFNRVACRAMSLGGHITLVSCIYASYGSSDLRYAAIATMSSMLSLATTAFISSARDPVRLPFCMSFNWRTT